MIHLFKKIYLKGDHQYKAERNCIIISPMYGRVGFIQGKFTDLANSRDFGDVFFQATSYDDLVNRVMEGDKDKLFRFLLDYPLDDRLTIYADVPTMYKLVTKFYKTVFPTMSENTFVMLVKFAFMRINYLFGAGFLPFVKLTDAQTSDYKKAANDILADTATIKAEWQTTKPWNLKKADHNVIMKHISVEFQLATYLTNPSWSYRHEFERKVVDMVKKGMLHDYVLDTKSMLTSSFINLKALEPTAAFNPMVNTMEDFVAQFPMYKFALDDKFAPDNADYIWRAYNLAELVTARRKMYALTETTSGQEQPGVADELFKKNLSMKDILDYEMTTPHTKILWTKNSYNEVVNSYLVDYILDAKRNNNLDAIKDIALVRG